MRNGKDSFLFLFLLWKGRGVVIAARAVLADGAGAEAEMVAVDIVLAAGVFVNFYRQSAAGRAILNP